MNEKETLSNFVEPDKKKPPVFKIVVGTVGGLFALAHVGLLGYVIHRPEEPKLPQVPTINIPRGPYSSYTIKAVRMDMKLSIVQTILKFYSRIDP